MTFYTVYKITNTSNGKVYVGVHKTDDLDDGYMGSGKLIQRAIQKHGPEVFEKEYLAVFDNADEMFEMESQIVNETFVSRGDTYNIREGGEGGWDHCSNSRVSITEQEGFPLVFTEAGIEKKRQLWATDEKWSADYRKALSNGLKASPKVGRSFRGRTHSDETKKRIGEKNAEHQRGSKNSQHGTCWICSDEEGMSKKIPKGDLADWLSRGWTKGRKMKFDGA